jgi:DNA-binding NtrC family response regulator
MAEALTTPDYKEELNKLDGANILVIEDEDKMRRLLEKVFSKHGAEVETASDGTEAIQRIKTSRFDIILADIKMPGTNGMEVLRTAKQHHPESMVIMMTAFGTVDSAVEAMKEGAYHYINKPFKIEEILLIINKALEEKDLRSEVVQLREEVRTKYQFDNIIGKSKVMQVVFDIVRRVSDSKSTVLIIGESGTGKELVAKAVHYNSPRQDKPFVALNCSAIPETLLESELFGHVKGSFTGAIANKKGIFESANQGTILLDEIGEISPAMQVKLLRVLQEREIKRVGSTSIITVDFRLIAATNKDLEEEVRRGNFRDDLFYRLSVIPIHLPSLRDRPEDIPLLANHFLKKFAAEANSSVRTISKEAMAYLVNYSWPGNVRELENVIERAITLGRHNSIVTEDLPPYVLTKSAVPSDESEDGDPTLEELEKDYIKKVLKKVKGHKIQAANILGIDRRTLYRKEKKYGLK